MTKQIYHERNLKNINTLGDNTKRQALKWYQYCIDNNIQVLIYEGIRTKEKQAENVKKGASQTMKSYHIVGQAFDFVPVDDKGNALWSISAYTTPKMLQAIKQAKLLGFTWGGDWDNDGDWRDEKFLDSPHFQYNYKGYGTDTFSGKSTATTTTPKKSYLSKGDRGTEVKEMQQGLKDLGYKISVDGIFGDGTLATVKQFQKDYKLTVDGLFGATSKNRLTNALKKTSNEEELTVSQYNELKKEIAELKELLGNKATSRVEGDTASKFATKQWEWLKEQGITDGSNPKGAITREQVSVMLKRFHEVFVEREGEVSESHSKHWNKANELGFLNGQNPRSYVTREQLATVIMRVVEYISGDKE